MANTSYQNWYNQQGTQPPVGSRAQAATFGGFYCPSNANVGYCHGTAPATAEIGLRGAAPLSLIGTKQTVQIDGSTYTGIVVRVEKTTNIKQGIKHNVKMVDMRDRLHDRQVFAQLNMLDATGRWYHIPPGNDWKGQIRRYVTTATNEDIDKAVFMKTDVFQWDCGNKLFAAGQIIYSLGLAFNFELTASERATEVLNHSFPENLDWNDGVKVIDAINEICERHSLQFTAWDDLHIHIDMRGVPDNPFLYGLVTGDPCQLPAYDAASIGAELNERGRKAIVVGGNTRVQLCYPCIPAWAPGFDEEAMFFGVKFKRLLAKYSLTDLNTMDELDKIASSNGNLNFGHQRFHNPKWKGKDVKEMTIREYMETFPYRVYALDFLHPVDEGELTLATNGDEYPFFQVTNLDTKESLVNFPVADALILPSDRQFLVGGHITVEGQKGVYEPIDISADRTYLTEGVSLDVQHEVNEECIDEYHVRVQFSKFQYWFDRTAPIGSRPKLPDMITCQLAVDLERYYWEYGDMTNTPRIREIVRVSNAVRQGFIFTSVARNADLVDITRPADKHISDNCPLAAILKTLPKLLEIPLILPDYGQQADPLYADQAVKSIGQQMLWHENITTSGFISFKNIAGLLPDGLVDSVNITFDAKTGMTEAANFTTLLNDVDSRNFRGIGRVPKQIRDEAAVRREQLIAMQRDLARKKNQNNATPNPAVVATGNVGGNVAAVRQRTAFGADNAVAVQVPLSLLDFMDELGTIEPGALLLIASPDVGDSQVDVPA